MQQDRFRLMGRPGHVAVAALAVLALAATPNGAVAADQSGRAGALASEVTDHNPAKRIMVSLERKRLWLVAGNDTLFTAPIAIGSGQVFRFGDRVWRFDTPRGQRRILEKDFTANWIPPDWHYLRKAASRGLEPVQLRDGDKIELSDGTFLEVRGMEVGRINLFGNWWPFSPGVELIFDGKIFIPPFGSPQRVIPNALGPVKLVLGDGYLIHGTHDFNERSIGTAASAGCIRTKNSDVERLARMVEVGTPVHIF
jgi:hypothetical protein